MTDRLPEIKARLDKCEKQTPLTIDEPEQDMVACPLCETEGYVSGTQWNYKQLAAGVSVHGIGDDLHNLQDLIAHCPDDLRWLISELEKERAETAMLRNNMKILKQEWKELSVPSANGCLERDCLRVATWLFTPADKQYYCAHHAAINKEKWGL